MDNMKPVAYVVDAETGEVIDSFYVGDSYKKETTKQRVQRDKYRKHNKIRNETTNFHKICTDRLDKVIDILSYAEYAFMGKLLKLISYDSGILYKNGVKSKKPLNIKDIAEITGVCYKTAKIYMKSLIDNEIILKIYDEDKKCYKYAFNYYICQKGNIYDSKMMLLFDRTQWSLF